MKAKGMPLFFLMAVAVFGGCVLLVGYILYDLRRHTESLKEAVVRSLEAAHSDEAIVTIQQLFGDDTQAVCVFENGVVPSPNEERDRALAHVLSLINRTDPSPDPEAWIIYSQTTTESIIKYRIQIGSDLSISPLPVNGKCVSAKGHVQLKRFRSGAEEPILTLKLL